MPSITDKSPEQFFCAHPLPQYSDMLPLSPFGLARLLTLLAGPNKSERKPRDFAQVRVILLFLQVLLLQLQLHYYYYCCCSAALLQLHYYCY